MSGAIRALDLDYVEPSYRARRGAGDDPARSLLAREVAGAVELSLEASPEDVLEPRRDFAQSGEVEARLDALALEEVDEILGRDVAARAGREWASAEAPDGGVEDGGAGLERSEGVRVARVARVVEVTTDGQAELEGLRDEASHLARDGDADRVGEHEHVG